MIEYIVTELNLTESRKPQIALFSETYRLKSYIQILKNNPEIFDLLKAVYPDKIKDNWDCVVELYRYNLKLSKAVYPYLAILENVLKIRLSEYLRQKYHENWYCDEGLFFHALEFDDFDRKIFEKYFNHKINKFVREDLINEYKEINRDYSKDRIKSKIQKIKHGISILSDARDYRLTNRNPCLQGFIETKPTLNYWITLLEVKKLYDAEDGKVVLKGIFVNIEKEEIRTLKTIAQKLDDIRLLRNDISHYNRIICRKIAGSLELRDIYRNIIAIFHLLGCNDVNWMIGDINCCPKGSFEGLYKELEFIHQYEIKLEKNFIKSVKEN